MQKCIIVLGMHRSGTSAVTHGLKVLGVDLGNRLLPALENINSKGFWEDIDIVNLNIEMLLALKSDWHYLAPIQPADIEVLRQKGYILRAFELLRRKIDVSPLFGFKDPRVAKLFPFWKEVFSQCQLKAYCVLAIRHPLSVVTSLSKRDGFDPVKSYLMWLGHVIASVAETAGEKRIVIDYDRLMQSPDFELNRLAKQFDLEIDLTELQSYKNEFIDQKLRHAVYDINDLLLDDDCPPLVHEVYSELLDVASDKKRIDDPSLQKEVAIWVNELARLKSSLALIDRLTQTFNQAILDRDVKMSILNQALLDRDAQIEEIVHSRSWRLTRPLRYFHQKLLSLRDKL